MAKHPVPKKKMSQARTASRYAAFVAKKHRKLLGFVHIVTCPSCASPTLLQQACPKCGIYRGRSVLAKGDSFEKITKIKA